MNTIEIYPSGTCVVTKIGSIKGMITCQSIRFDKVQYELTYLDGGEFRTVWVNEKEFDVTDGVEKSLVGFKQTK